MGVFGGRVTPGSAQVLLLAGLEHYMGCQGAAAGRLSTFPAVLFFLVPEKKLIKKKKKAKFQRLEVNVNASPIKKPITGSEISQRSCAQALHMEGLGSGPNIQMWSPEHLQANFPVTPLDRNSW